MSQPHIEYHYEFNYHGHVMTSYSMRPTSERFESLVEDHVKDFKPLGLEWPKWAWPGGYPLYYVVKDCGVLCADCANKELSRTLDPSDDQFFIVGQDINYEDNDLYCDHCNAQIKSAYGDDA